MHGRWSANCPIEPSEDAVEGRSVRRVPGTCRYEASLARKLDLHCRRLRTRRAIPYRGDQHRGEAVIDPGLSAPAIDLARTNIGRRAISVTTAPEARLSATIARFCSALRRRRRSGPVMTSTLAIAPSVAPVQTRLLAPVLTSPTRRRYATRRSPDGYRAERDGIASNLVRTGLPAGGNRIRTAGPAPETACGQSGALARQAKPFNVQARNGDGPSGQALTAVPFAVGPKV
jgi:hypothetical protein